MLYFPRGVMNHEVCDPDVLAQEFRDAAALARSTTQYQWERAIFGVTDLEKGTLVAMLQHTVTAKSNLSVALGTQVPQYPGDINVDANTWQVPYNRGLVCVGDMPPAGAPYTPSRIQWTSAYPELAIGLFNYQYGRTSYDWATGPYYTWINDVEGRHVRLQVRVRFDGGDVEGTGPFCWPLATRVFRGAGLAQIAIRSTCAAFRFLPAGSHTVEAMAGLTDAHAGGDTSGEPASYPPQTCDLDRGVGILNRKLILFRFAFALPLPG